MAPSIQSWKNFSWKSALAPMVALLCLILLTKQILFSSQQFLFRTETITAPGEPAIVDYVVTGHFYVFVLVALLFSVSLIQTLRQWAHYFLSRKLVLSYLLFGAVPIGTLCLIFIYGVRIWFGLSNALNVEKAMEMASRELETMVFNTTTAVAATKAGPKQVSEMLQGLGTGSLSQRSFIDASGLEVSLYLQTPKLPGQPLFMYLLGSRRRSDSPVFPNVIREDRNTEDFEYIVPTWYKGQSSFTNIVTRGERIYLQHLRFVDYDTQGTRLVAQANIPIDEPFLARLKEFLPVKVNLESESQNYFISTENDNSKWYLQILLKPLASTWDIQTMNWATGYFEYYGLIGFELEGSEIIGTMTRSGPMDLFHDSEKNLVFQLILFSTGMLVLTLALASLYGLYLISYITRSLNLIADGHERVAETNLDFRLPYLGKDQLGAMGRSFNSMASNIESLLKQVMEQQRYKEELRIARDIQMSLLPDLEILKWCRQVTATCIPAREVGGDYYEVVRPKDDLLGVFIADVSGKGTSAAFFMAEAKGVLLAMKDHWDDPAELMLNMNEVLHRALRNNVFISAAYFLLDTRTGEGKLARAGHCPAFHVRPEGTIEDLSPPGMAIGIADNRVFGRILKIAEFKMEPGDKLILYTDGLDEMTFHNEMYGVNRLKKVLRENAGLDVTGLKESILQDVLGFLSSGEQNDDLTLVVAGMTDEALGDAKC
jgi:serine phosphatase RsbU (regulator of sigma subunit)